MIPIDMVIWMVVYGRFKEVLLSKTYCCSNAKPDKPSSAQLAFKPFSNKAAKIKQAYSELNPAARPGINSAEF